MLPNEPLFPVISDGSGSSGSGNFQGVLPSAPSGPSEGWTYINSGDNGYYIYFCGAWQLIVQLTCQDAFLLLEDGSFVLYEDGTSRLVLENH